MNLVDFLGRSAALGITLVLASGCRSAASRQAKPPVAGSVRPTAEGGSTGPGTTEAAAAAQPISVTSYSAASPGDSRAAAYSQDAGAVAPAPVAPAPYALPSPEVPPLRAAPVGGEATVDLDAPNSVLAVDPLVALVLERNPSIEAMMAGWRAAAQRYPQVVSLDDPVFMSMVAPASFSSNTTEPAFIVGGSQKLPWFGKRSARGRVAQAETSAAYQDVQSTRLEVAEAARMAFFDYYLAERLLRLNQENRVQMERFRDTARRRFEANLVTQQDVLQADVAISEVARRDLELQRMRRVAIARINTLLLRAPDAPLPPPPATLAEPTPLPPAEELRAWAVNCRPDLAALGARIRADEATAAVAAKDFYPDVEVYGRYDSFWQPSSTQSPLRAQTGVNMNVPIYRRKRYAAVNESLFRAGQKRAEYQQRLNDIHYEVQSVYEQVEQSRQTVELYRDRFLPAAESNVSAARSSYDVGQTQFLSLIQAQQQLIALREKQAEAQADSYRRRAELERVVGCPIPN